MGFFFDRGGKLISPISPIYEEWIDLKSFDLPSSSHSIENNYLYGDHLEIAYHNPCKDTSEYYVDTHSF